MLLSFPGMQLQSDGRYVVPAGSMGSVYNNSILASNISKESSLNSFVCGVKFLVLFQVTKTPEPAKKKERLRPVIREVVLHKDYRKELVCGVMDAINDKPLSAKVVICDLNNLNDTLFNDYTSKEEGLCTALLDMNKMYALEVFKEGYMTHTDTIKSLNESVYISMQPIKKNTVVVLNNLFFDTSKTNIKNTSTQSLEDLYRMLVENPKIRIMITGHTDNVASDVYNLKLSEGRAKAVYDEMVRRGIDPKRMKWQGKGEREPIESNKTEEGRAANRRVEVKIL
jgi:outer membrane protein OmpA-like peptidoglycan-associated protein